MDIQGRVYRMVVTMLAGMLAGRLLAAGWRLAMKQAPPRDTEDLTQPAVPAVLFAGLAGGVAAVAHTLAARHASRRAADRRG